MGLDPYKARSWSVEDLARFVSMLRKTSKPLIVAANKADREQAEKNVEYLRMAGYQVVPTSAEAELVLRKAAASNLIRYTPGDRDFDVIDASKISGGQLKALDLIRERVLLRWRTTGVQEIINSAFSQLLNSIVVYPVEDAEKFTDHMGRVLPDCYLVPKGTTARQLAGLIHTELAESFIYAVNAKTKMRLSDNYEIQDNDVIQIVAAKARK
jgi:ribosome-binding ATPase YchF (GTP1/OBG family)